MHSPNHVAQSSLVLVMHFAKFDWNILKKHYCQDDKLVISTVAAQLEAAPVQTKTAISLKGWYPI